MQYHQSRILCALRDKVAENKSLTGHQAMERARARMTRLGSGSRELFDRWLSSFARLARALCQNGHNDVRPVQDIEHHPVQWPNISGRVCVQIDPGAGDHHPGEAQQLAREPLLTTDTLWLLCRGRLVGWRVLSGGDDRRSRRTGPLLGEQFDLGDGGI